MSRGRRPQHAVREMVPIPIVKMPRWVFVLVIGILLQLAFMVFNAGGQVDRQKTLENRVDTMDKRFDKIEDRLDKILERVMQNK